MGAFDFQVGVIDEVAFNTPLTVTRFTEYSAPASPVVGIPGRTEGNPLRVGSRARRQSRVVPYLDHAEGTLPLEVMNKGYGFWLKHMLPNVASSGAGPFVYTATEGTSSQSVGKSFTYQQNSPFHPTGTNQAITCSGGKVSQWTMHCAAPTDMLQCDLDLWFASMTTGTALATASYPSSMSNFAWTHGAVTIGGTPVPLESFSVQVNQNYDLERWKLGGTHGEPTPGPLEITWEATADFDALTQWNRVFSTTTAGLSAAIVATFTNSPDILSVSLPGARFDDFSFDGETGGLKQTFGGAAEYDGTNSPISVVYTTSDATA